jgi:hypothetical protein
MARLPLDIEAEIDKTGLVDKAEVSFKILIPKSPPQEMS